MLVGKWQILPQIVQVTRRFALVSIIPFPTEHPDESLPVRLRPDFASPGSAATVVYKRGAQGKGYGYGLKHVVLFYLAYSLPPDPLPRAVLKLPDVVQESGRVCDGGAVSPATKEPEV